MDKNILLMAGYCRLLRALRHQASSQHLLPMPQMDAAMLLRLLHNQPLIGDETSRLLSRVHSAVINQATIEQPASVRDSLSQLQAALDASPRPPAPVPAFYSPPERSMQLIVPRDLVALPGQVYMLWAGHALTVELINASLGGPQWAVLRPPDSSVGVAGVMLAGVPFWLSTADGSGEIHSRWVISLQQRVEITSQPGPRRATVAVSEQRFSPEVVQELLSEVSRLPVPALALDRLREQAQRRPDLAVYTALEWLATPGDVAHFDRSAELLCRGRSRTHLRLLS
jgi:hypothetical protein